MACTFADLADYAICMSSTAKDVANGTVAKAATKLTVLMSCCHALVLPRLDQEAGDGFLAERLGSLQAVKALDEYETRSVGPH